MPMLKKKPVDANDIRTFMAINLKSYEQRAVVVLDNAGVDRRSDMRKLVVRSTPLRLHCPNKPYRNPVE